MGTKIMEIIEIIKIIEIIIPIVIIASLALVFFASSAIAIFPRRFLAFMNDTYLGIKTKLPKIIFAQEEEIKEASKWININENLKESLGLWTLRIMAAIVALGSGFALSLFLAGVISYWLAGAK
jgi:hypothetical protein